MKEFVVYTALRIVLFLASFGVVVGLMALAFGGRYNLFWAVISAFLISGVGSYFILNRQREAFARRVEERAGRATAKIEEMRTKPSFVHVSGAGQRESHVHDVQITKEPPNYRAG